MFCDCSFVWTAVLGVVILLSILWYASLPKKQEINGKTVLITGGALGIGREMVLELLSRGCTVIVWDIYVEGLQSLEKESKAPLFKSGRLITAEVDVSSSTAVTDSSKTVLETVGGSIDILINNAGVVFKGTLLDSPSDEIRRTVDVNTLANFWTVRSFLPSMLKKNEGHIVTVSSVAGFNGTNGLAAYHVSKFGNFGFSDCLRHEIHSLGGTNIHTTVVCPYLIDTGMFEGLTVPWSSKFITGTDSLKTRDVALRVLSGIEKRERFIVIPFHLRLMFLLRLLPVSFMDLLVRFTGAIEAMSTFKGRGREFSMTGKKNN